MKWLLFRIRLAWWRQALRAWPTACRTCGAAEGRPCLPPPEVYALYRYRGSSVALLGYRCPGRASG